LENVITPQIWIVQIPHQVNEQTPVVWGYQHNYLNLLSGKYATQEPINSKKMSSAVSFSNNSNQIRNGRDNDSNIVTARNPTIERRRKRKM